MGRDTRPVRGALARINAPITRRALLGATAAVGAVGLPALVTAEAVIPVSDLDAELFALLDRWHEAQAAWEATAEPYDAAQARAHAAYPPRPDALRSGFGDQCYAFGAAASGREPKPSGRIGTFFTSEDVERLRNSSPVTQWATGVARQSGSLPLRQSNVLDHHSGLATQLHCSSSVKTGTSAVKLGLSGHRRWRLRA